MDINDGPVIDYRIEGCHDFAYFLLVCVMHVFIYNIKRFLLRSPPSPFLFYNVVEG